MKRLLIIIFKNLVRLPKFTYRMYHMAAHPERYTLEEKAQIPIYLTERVKTSGNVEIKEFGKENIPEDSGFILVPNHQGIFDGFAIEYVVQTPFFPVLKKELMRIPFVNKLFLCMDALSMDRDDVRQSVKIIGQAAKRVKAGQNALIFPEGTRSRNGNQVGEFKGGSFKIATKTRCTIVPVALIDSYKPFDKDSFGSVTVQVHILKPIPYEEYKDMKTTEIARMVQTEIEECIKEYEVLV